MSANPSRFSRMSKADGGAAAGGGAIWVDMTDGGPRPGEPASGKTRSRGVRTAIVYVALQFRAAGAGPGRANSAQSALDVRPDRTGPRRHALPDHEPGDDAVSGRCLCGRHVRPALRPLDPQPLAARGPA